MQVTGKLARPHPIFVHHFKFVQSVSKVAQKQTIPSPSNMHFRGRRMAIDQKAYPDMAEFYADLARVYSEEVRDLAAAGCRYLQIDEVYIAYLCDPALREQVAALGENPQTLPRTYVAMINGAVAGRPPDMTVCMHLCRGNNQSGWVASGGYEPVAAVTSHRCSRSSRGTRASASSAFRTAERTSRPCATRSRRKPSSRAA